MATLLQIAQDVIDCQDGDAITTIGGTILTPVDISTLPQQKRRLKRHINKAMNVVKLALGIKNESAEFETTLTTVPNQESYPFPTGMLTIEQVKFSNDFPLAIIPWDDYERFKSDYILQYIPINSNPYNCTIYQRQIWFFPLPNQAYTFAIRGLATLVELALDTDEPPFPEEFHRVIKEFALYYEMKYENNPNAGDLVVGMGGNMQGQGGQAAEAVLMFELVKKTFRQHFAQGPRIKSIHELQYHDFWRRYYKP